MGAPGLRGYAIAVCGFEEAEGRSSITRGAAQFDVAAETIEFDAARDRILGAEALHLPFVTARDGFETEITITDTTEDWLGTSQGSNVCSLQYVGSNSPGIETTQVFFSGDQFVFQEIAQLRAELARVNGEIDRFVGELGVQREAISTAEWQLAQRPSDPRLLEALLPGPVLALHQAAGRRPRPPSSAGQVRRPTAS